MSLGGKRNLGSLSSQQINARAGTDIKTISLIHLSIVSEDICVAGLGADASLYRRSGTLGQPILGARSKCEQCHYVAKWIPNWVPTILWVTFNSLWVSALCFYFKVLKTKFAWRFVGWQRASRCDLLSSSKVSLSKIEKEELLRLKITEVDC